MTEEKAFDFYFIVGYSPGGAPYGITMEEAEEEGLLEEEEKDLNSFEDNLPL